jgi:hypothetical protein
LTHITDRLRWPSYLRRLPNRDRVAKALDHAQHSPTTANSSSDDLSKVDTPRHEKPRA